MYQNETYPDDETLGGEWKETGAASPPSKEDLVEMLRRSHRTWLIVTQDNSAAKKAADILETMLTKIEQSKKAREGVSIPTWQKQMAIGNGGPLSGPPITGKSCSLAVFCCEVVKLTIRWWCRRKLVIRTNRPHPDRTSTGASLGGRFLGRPASGS
jgi:hypothetical protein